MRKKAFSGIGRLPFTFLTRLISRRRKPINLDQQAVPPDETQDGPPLFVFPDLCHSKRGNYCVTSRVSWRISAALLADSNYMSRLLKTLLRTNQPRLLRRRQRAPLFTFWDVNKIVTRR